MKTLVAIANAELRELFWTKASIDKLAGFSAIDFVPLNRPFTSADLADRIGDYEACITSWGSPVFTPEALARAGKLAFIGHGAGSVASIVNEDVFATAIAVTSANPVLALSTAECAVALILAGAWDMKSYSARIPRGEWSNNNRETVLGVTGRTIGLVGYGEIAKHVIRMLKPFDAELLLYSAHCTREEADALGVGLCGLNELFERSDIVSLHNTWTPRTEGMIGAEQLKRLKDGALLVNTARGPIVQEAALLDELRANRIRASLDVYDREPLPADHELLAMPNAFCLPHIGGFHGPLKRRLCDFVVDELGRFAKGERLLGRITLDRYRRLTPR
ncbi:hydroxyacid dehydrogenase [Paenibacillus glycinis]|uniref:D-isomer specific 2-hydroxyacid dehydrogenase NAD-binding domain-containing protein n=1 Tax=Paenibacillus glycinis TaxID=2697035 RepID=A0ABW9XMN0_9BACL|nr:hydroxyacid dehydrogenase [Paenibacillus glycinis]NBD23895.1 hypothetical protein [Paenibacillus glycinis]